MQKLQKVYEDFLSQFPTTLQQDMAILRDPVQSKKLTVRQHAAILFRSEQKRILINQITLIKIIQHILERLMRGMTIEFAVTRIFELESRKDHPVNRLMIDNYLTSLKVGLKKNQEDYFKVRNMDPVKGKQLMMETQKNIMQDMNKIAFRQFEIKGYEQMLERMLHQPLQGAITSKNTELEEKLRQIQKTLTNQQEKNRAIESSVEKKVTETLFQRELREAIERKKEEMLEAKKVDEITKELEDEESKGEDDDDDKKDKDESEEESSYYDTEEDEEEDD